MIYNAIFVIKPYKWNGLWVFDDDRVGLVREPFVAGADTMIDTAIQISGIPNADDGFLLSFSTNPMPHLLAWTPFNLEWVREEEGGNVYRGVFNVGEAAQEMEGRLCPALNLYYPVAPKKLFCAIAKLSSH